MIGILLAGSPVDLRAEGAETFLEPYRSIEISAVESGVIREILVEEGESVTAGQTLIRLDTEVVEAELARALAQSETQGRVVAAEAEFNRQKERFEQLQSLSGRGTTNAAELAREGATLTVLEGNLMAAREEQEIAKLDAARIEAELNRRLLVSPIDGTVAEIVKDVAEPVSAAGDRPGEAQKSYLIRVVQLDLLKATAFLAYDKVRGLKVGDRIVLAMDDAGEARRIEAQVEFVAPLVDPATGTVAVRAKIDNREGALVSGLPVRFLVEEAESK